MTFAVEAVVSAWVRVRMLYERNTYWRLPVVYDEASEAMDNLDWAVRQLASLVQVAPDEEADEERQEGPGAQDDEEDE